MRVSQAQKAQLGAYRGHQLPATSSVHDLSISLVLKVKGARDPALSACQPRKALLTAYSWHCIVSLMIQVICRWDNCCCEEDAWQQAADVSDLQQGGQQTFYHLLVDAKDWEESRGQPAVAYVAEELLSAPEVRQPLSCQIKLKEYGSQQWLATSSTQSLLWTVLCPSLCSICSNCNTSSCSSYHAQLAKLTACHCDDVKMKYSATRVYAQLSSQVSTSSA